MFRVEGSGLRVQGSGCRVEGAGCRVQGSGFRVQGSGRVTHHRARLKTLPRGKSLYYWRYRCVTPLWFVVQICLYYSWYKYVSIIRGTNMLLSFVIKIRSPAGANFVNRAHFRPTVGGFVLIKKHVNSRIIGWSRRVSLRASRNPAKGGGSA